MAIGTTTVAVVVPALNEEDFIEEVVATMPPFVDRIMVVDDGSTDRTVARAESLGVDRVEVLQHVRRRGVGAAITTGYRRALVAGIDVVAVMAGDGQMLPDELHDVVQPVVQGRADYVKGERFSHARVLQQMPIQRLAGSWLLGHLTARATGYQLTDSQCGFTAIGRTALSRLDLNSLWTGYGYPNDFLGALSRIGATVAEVSVTPRYRGETSGLRARHVATIGWLIARHRWRALRHGSVELNLGGGIAAGGTA